MELTINGEARTVPDDATAMLLWVLRDDLGLTGTKFGCGAGLCGACTVHVDGVATRSCTTPLSAVVGKSVTTIEGLATLGDDGVERLHPVQQAFLDLQVPQCGYCMSGQIMQAAALLAATPTPDEAQIVEAMGENLCRCGCYERIRRAVARAAASA